LSLLREARGSPRCISLVLQVGFETGRVQEEYYGLWHRRSERQLHRGSGFAGGKQTVYTLGINWYPNDNLRFMLDYLHGVIDRTEAGNGGAVPICTSKALRTQFAF
jgi:phosphate-selective porin